MDVKDLPEAPASVTARVISSDGFHVLFTLRDTTVSGLLEKFEKFQKAIVLKGWKPETSGKQEKLNQQVAIPVAEKTTCTTCGAPATKKSGTRKDGSTWEGIFCSSGEDSHKVWLQ